MKDRRCYPRRTTPIFKSSKVPDTSAILHEEIHDTRIIPLDGRPHLGPNIRQYLGDSRGHWEGNTLVVDTTNFNDKTNFHGSGENLHVIERFTRVDADTILYQFTVEDPTTWTRPWSAELPMTKIQGRYMSLHVTKEISIW